MLTFMTRIVSRDSNHRETIAAPIKASAFVWCIRTSAYLFVDKRDDVSTAEFNYPVTSNHSRLVKFSSKKFREWFLSLADLTRYNFKYC